MRCCNCDRPSIIRDDTLGGDFKLDLCLDCHLLFDKHRKREDREWFLRGVAAMKGAARLEVQKAGFESFKDKLTFLDVVLERAETAVRKRAYSMEDA